MIEIPESATLAAQMQTTLGGKIVRRVHTASSEHKFTFFNGDPAGYNDLLAGKKVTGTRGQGMFADLLFEDGCMLTINDGVNVRYVENAFAGEGQGSAKSRPPSAALPAKYQLLIEFTDASVLVFTVAMYGGIWAFQGEFDNPYYQGSLHAVSPLADAFDEAYFAGLLAACRKDLSAKAFLATEQRIPGLGNGCVQDILLSCRVHPKRKMSTLTPAQKDDMLYALKAVLQDMTEKGGRDTEKDLFGNPGGYKTLLSRLTYKNPCHFCGGSIVKEAYLGGSVYYCPDCQGDD